MKITTYKYEKVPVKDTEIFIPNKPFYCFQTGVRRSVRMIPEFVTWDTDPINKKGGVYALNVTCVYLSFECIIEKFTIIVNRIEDHVNGEGKSMEAQISNMLLHENYYVRTEESFNNDLKVALSKIKEV